MNDKPKEPTLATGIEVSDPERVDGKALLDDVAREIVRYVVLPKWAPEALALWVVHTYAFQLRDVTAYVGIESPEKRCGKTTLLNLLAKLAHRAVVASNISSPAFFRVIEEMQPTLMIDEADTFLPSNDEMRGILNSGYTKDSAFVWRVASQSVQNRATPSSASTRPGKAVAPGDEEFGENERVQERRSGCGSQTSSWSAGAPDSQLVKYSSWCPKVVSSIGRLPDTLSDRCIMIRMQRKLLDEQCRKLRELDPAPLSGRCARFVQQHADKIARAQPSIPAELNDRAGDIWEPLFVLADLAGGEWPAKARQGAYALSTSAQERSPIGSLLVDLFMVFTAKEVDRLFTRDLLTDLNCKRGRPWQEARNGKPYTDVCLGRELRRFGVTSKTIWIGERAAKGYLLAEVKEVCRRYVPRSEVQAFCDEI